MLTNQNPESASCQGNAVASIIASVMAGMSFIDIVLVKDVDGDTLTILPLVNDVDVSGGSISNNDVYQIPFLRLQAGNSAVKMAPRPGDIGLIAICDKDTTNVRKSKRGGPAPTQRRHSYSDAVYITAIASLNDEPTEFVEFTGSGINIKSPGRVNINGLKIHPNGQLELVDGSIVDGHDHGGVESGGSRTNPLEP
ncbi:hypothetical protein EDF73_1109 [Raoultella sp. BIGb0138]|uniref:hypothetical protein n=1 Tax=Raoultella sp. BIGb0138 TaxID=2485115 RepID=UPI001045D5B9|nr:hypothetical protein [Raoultella sp. BIGb0138]TCW09235.1 hypothetical protein EDF73_1109 [Raoultella sp. BIGb0138]